jgi:hypothetical protein
MKILPVPTQKSFTHAIKCSETRGVWHLRLRHRYNRYCETMLARWGMLMPRFDVADPGEIYPEVGPLSSALRRLPLDSTILVAMTTAVISCN